MLQITIEQDWIYKETQYYSLHKDVLPENFHTLPMHEQAAYIQRHYDIDDYEAEPIQAEEVISLTIVDEGGDDY